MSVIYALFLLAVGVMLCASGLILFSLPPYRRMCLPAIMVGAVLAYCTIAWS